MAPWALGFLSASIPPSETLQSLALALFQGTWGTPNRTFALLGTFPPFLPEPSMSDKAWVGFPCTCVPGTVWHAPILSVHLSFPRGPDTILGAPCLVFY